MANFWDTLGTNFGDALLGQSFGSLMPMSPEQRTAAYGPALLSLSASLYNSARNNQGPLEALGQGFQNLSAQGAQRGQQQLQSALLMGKIGEQQRKNQTRAALKKNLPEGMTAEMIDALPEDQLGKVLFESYQRQRDRQAMTGTGDFPGMGPASGGSASAPSGGGFNIGNLRAQGGGFQTFGTPEEAVAAAVRNVQAYPARFNNGQPMTLLQVGERWAPKGDGANDPAQWARNVASIGGLPVDQPLDFRNPQIAERFARGVHGAEFGQGAAYQPDVYGRGVASIANRTAGVTAPNPPAGVPSPVQPTQYIPPGQGTSAAPQAPAIDYQSDAVIREAAQAARIAQQRGDVKGYQEARQRAAARIAEMQQQAELRTRDTRDYTLRKGADERAAAGQSAEGQVVTIDGRHIWRSKIGGQMTDLGSADSPIDREKLRLAQEADKRSARDQQVSEANRDVILDASGRPQINQTAVGAKAAVSAAQGENAARIASQNKAGGVIAEKAAAQFADLREKATAAASEIEAIHAGRQILDSGAFTGLGANQGVLLGRVGELLGMPSDKAVNAQVFGPVMASRVFALVKNLGSGTGISEGDRKFAAQAAAGEITLDEPALRRLLDIGERGARRVITKFNNEGEGWRKTTPNVETLPDSVFSTAMPPGYADWAKANPLAPLQRGTTQPTQQAPPSYRWDGKKLVPVQ